MLNNLKYKALGYAVLLPMALNGVAELAGAKDKLDKFQYEFLKMNPVNFGISMFQDFKKGDYERAPVQVGFLLSSICASTALYFGVARNINSLRVLGGALCAVTMALSFSNAQDNQYGQTL